MHRKFGNKGLEKIYRENINQKNSHVSNISVDFLLCKIEMMVCHNASLSRLDDIMFKCVTQAQFIIDTQSLLDLNLLS